MKFWGVQGENEAFPIDLQRDTGFNGATQLTGDDNGEIRKRQSRWKETNHCAKAEIANCEAALGRSPRPQQSGSQPRVPPEIPRPASYQVIFRVPEMGLDSQNRPLASA